ANLGQLKQMFPDYVVEGLVIPFGIFRQHMNQKMPGYDGSYWEYLNASFAEAEQQRNNGSSAEAVNRFTLEKLNRLRTAIMQIELLPDFVEELESGFKKTFGNRLGNVPVFLRSDTNMEDLAEFTGAGLNLTKFNVVNRDKIIKGIKEVWASPYTERSFKWRQSYLLNPENVFPSILIIPTVDVEHSGVVITKGITTNDGRDVTIAFSRGAGGAVDGQAAETYLLQHNYDNVLLSPAREQDVRRLPQTGGSVMNKTTFEQPILSDKNLNTLRELAYDIHQRFPKSETGSHGPFDIELGFANDQPWLFQGRPFVENDNAKTYEYLESISPKLEGEIAVR
ncbi:MAG: PEP/pyruvate-binding domain-containing protein, partial [Saprospiraceae bacterium]